MNPDNTYHTHVLIKEGRRYRWVNATLLDHIKQVQVQIENFRLKAESIEDSVATVRVKLDRLRSMIG